MAVADGAATARLPETYQWLLVPVQNTPQAPMTWEALRLSGSDALAVRASRKLRSDELYLTSFAPTRLRMELDRVPLWRGDHVAVRQLVEDFARYLYLPRLKDSAVLLHAISDGVNLLTWSQDGYGLADSYDEVAGRYQGLRGGSLVNLVDPHATGLVVKPEVASRQLDAERKEPEPGGTGPGTGAAAGGGAATGTGTGAGSVGGSISGGTPSARSRPKRFHGSVSLDANRVGRDAGKIAEEVIAHLVGLVGAQVSVTLEIAANVPDGAPDSVVRTVTENARTLRFAPGSGFEKE